MDGLVSCKVALDGSDSTDKIIKMIVKSKFYSQLQAILLDGAAVAGFNVIDAKKLSEKTKIPVITIIRDYPDFEKIFNALKKLGMQEKIKLLEQLGEPKKINKIYVQLVNISLRKATEILRITCTHSHIPEAIRIAHLIGAGLVLGESRGRA